jgi:hypothetical protein
MATTTSPTTTSKVDERVISLSASEGVRSVGRDSTGRKINGGKEPGG